MFALTFGPGQMLADGWTPYRRLVCRGVRPPGRRGYCTVVRPCWWTAIAGVGGVLTFLPQIAVLFLFVLS